MLYGATSVSCHGHPLKKLLDPLASTTRRSDGCKDGPASLRARRSALKMCDGGTMSPGGCGFGQGTVRWLSQLRFILGTL